MGKHYIYLMTNKINNKKYVGQTNNLKRRIKYQHFNAGHVKTVIDKAILKYGKENFEVKVIEETTKDKVNEREIYWIKKYNTYKGVGYNCTPGGESLSGKDNPMYGVSLSGKLNGMYGRKRSQRVKDKLKKFHTGLKHKEETKNKISEATKGSNNPRAKIKLKDVYDIFKLYFEENKSGYKIGEIYNVSNNTIYEIINCQHWTTRDLKRGD
jgi:group I intron endonuclease